MLTTVHRGRFAGVTSSKHFDVSSAFDFPNLLCRYTALNSLKLFRSKIYGYILNCVHNFSQNSVAFLCGRRWWVRGVHAARSSAARAGDRTTAARRG